MMEPAAKRMRSDGGEDFSKLTMRQCHQLLKPLLKMDEAIYFDRPVDPIALGIRSGTPKSQVLVQVKGQRRLGRRTAWWWIST